MAEPDFLICLECESPCYTFEWGETDLPKEALCTVCGNDTPEEFATLEDFEAMASAPLPHQHPSRRQHRMN